MGALTVRILERKVCVIYLDSEIWLSIYDHCTPPSICPQLPSTLN
jgi:hypothetical protein